MPRTRQTARLAEADRSRRLLYASEMSVAQQVWEAGDTGRARAMLEKQWPQAGQEDLRGFEWRHLWRLCSDGSRRSWRGHHAVISAIAFSPDGQTLASSGCDQGVRLWDMTTQRQVKLGLGVNVRSLAFSPDGNTLAMAEWGGRMDSPVGPRRTMPASDPRPAIRYPSGLLA